ncbi:MAG TPA: penicillin-binding transpeptidase domain-containing protein [Gemmatimonadaceae bacterium]|jgi:cell division protein FtsI (penicillin-binding protein 3)|nr:penicillin-binding transpeptidase domain-containing protein [Gemmatimonadaceae bacterium]
MLIGKRLTIISVMLLLFAVALIAQAAKLQLFEGDLWSQRAAALHFDSDTLSAPRGAILDASGNVLVDSHELVHIDIAPREVRDRQALVEQLELERVAPELIARATDTTVKWLSLPDYYVASEIAALVKMPGVHAKTVMQRDFATAGGIRRIVGRVGPDGRALDGIELSMDSVLQGTSGGARRAVDVRGRPMDSPEGWRTEPHPGATVMLTINESLQEICERALARASDSLEAEGGDIVVMNPLNGDVLAMASRRSNPRAVANTAVSEPFEPGSTVKPFIAAALLEHGKARPDEMIETFNGQTVLEGRLVTDGHKAKELSLSDVIRYSSNIGIVRFAERLSPREKYEALRDFGLGTQTGIPLPAESEGTLRQPNKWNRTSGSSMAMGYELAVTPLQLVAAYSAIANGGELLEPHIIKEIRSADGELLYRSTPRVIRRVVSPSVASAIQQMLLGVVESGTATRADLATYLLGGKSGTARRTEQGKGYVLGNYTASFVGLFPADKPQYVVLVKLDSPRHDYYGGEIAAPVTKVVLRAALAARDAALNREELATVERVRGGNADSLAQSESAAAGSSNATEPVRELEEAPAQHGAVTIALPFAPRKQVVDQTPRDVPDVTGLTLRDAVRALHRSGFRVRLTPQRGGATIPAAGTMLPPGSIVKLQHLQ